MAHVIYDHTGLQNVCDYCYDHHNGKGELLKTDYPMEAIDANEQWELTADPNQAHTCHECGSPIYCSTSKEHNYFERRVIASGEGRVALVRFGKSMGGDIMTHFLKELESLLQNQVSHVILDLTGIQTIYSNGAGMLAAAHRGLKHYNGKLIVLADQRRIVDFFKESQPWKDLTVVQELDDALYLCHVIWAAQTAQTW